MSEKSSLRPKNSSEPARDVIVTTPARARSIRSRVERVRTPRAGAMTILDEKHFLDKSLLAISQFKSKTKAGRAMPFLQMAEKIMRSGAVSKPAWLDAMRACVPASPVPVPRPSHRALRVVTVRSRGVVAPRAASAARDRRSCSLSFSSFRVRD
jgi:hypothetical protein